MVYLVIQLESDQNRIWTQDFISLKVLLFHFTQFTDELMCY